MINKLEYIFDPLCGWCYASAPALAYLAANYPQRLELLPSGLFSESGARTINAQWAQHAWSNDQRIASINGQIFSDKYHALLHSGANFDSGFMNRALTIFNDISPSIEAGLLHQLQISRYVDGEDTSRSDIVAKICTDYAKLNNLNLSQDYFKEQLTSDISLHNKTDDRINKVKTLMNDRGISGVPMLLATVGDTTHVISGADLYLGPDSIRNALSEIDKP